MLFNPFIGPAIRIFLLALLTFSIYVLYDANADVTKYIKVKSCEKDAVICLKTLTKMVDKSWFRSKQYDIIIKSQRGYLCHFFRFDEEHHTLYYGYEIPSGSVVGVDMSLDQLRQFQDTLSPNTAFTQVEKYLYERQKTNPPTHEF